MRRTLTLFSPITHMPTDEHISASRPYLNFNLELSEEEKVLLQNFDLSLFGSIGKDLSQFEHYGDLSGLEEELKVYLRLLGDNKEEDIVSAAKIMTRLSNNVLEHFEQTQGWICLRPSLPHDGFKIPRWHRDGYFYAPYEDPQVKVIMTFQGAPTLFYEASPAQQEALKKLEAETPPLSPTMRNFMAYQERIREKLAKEVFDISDAITAQVGQGTIFAVGAHGAVHSEPHITKPRLFFSVLPGTAEQIAEWQKNVHPELAETAPAPGKA